MMVEKEEIEFLKILVPVAGTTADEGAIELACKLSKSKNNNCEIFAIHVIPVERSLPLDAEDTTKIDAAENILSNIESIAEKQGCPIETEMMQARDIGSTIIEEAKKRAVDLVLMGISYKQHFGQFCLGDVIPYVLENAPCRVLIDHQLQSEL
jgi:nucleotide-binding universal stress UspA family protein